MKISNKDIIGEVVAKDYRTASVFKKAGIDFCCRGNRSIETVVEDENKMESLVAELNEVLDLKSQDQIDFQAWPLDLLADYIEKTHHRYVESKIQEIKPFLNKVAKVHGKNHPELMDIEMEFLTSAGELSMHMKKEELVLFPFIRKMVANEKQPDSIEEPHFGSVQNPVEMMKEEHDAEGERFRRIAKLSNDYPPPADACNTFRVTYSMLQEFEENLHQHIHLENNILFPKALKLEEKLFNQKS